MIEKFSPELCQHLSILVPGFEGHWWWTYPYLNAPHAEVVCYEDLNISVKICPAWQVEDVLRNLKAIGEKLNWGWVCGDCGHERPRKAEPGDVRCDCDDPWYSWPQKYSNRAGEILAGYLHDHPDTYYQKIEEYLWTVLK